MNSWRVIILDEEHSYSSADPAMYILGRLEVTMNDLVRMKVVHSIGYLLCPVEEQCRRQSLSVPEYFIQLTIWTVFHDYTVTWRLGTDTSGKTQQKQCKIIINLLFMKILQNKNLYAATSSGHICIHILHECL